MKIRRHGAHKGAVYNLLSSTLVFLRTVDCQDPDRCKKCGSSFWASRNTEAVLCCVPRSEACPTCRTPAVVLTTHWGHTMALSSPICAFFMKIEKIKYKGKLQREKHSQRPSNPKTLSLIVAVGGRLHSTYCFRHGFTLYVFRGKGWTKNKISMMPSHINFIYVT